MHRSTLYVAFIDAYGRDDLLFNACHVDEDAMQPVFCGSKQTKKRRKGEKS